jgi:hypothetical protein
MKRLVLVGTILSLLLVGSPSSATPLSGTFVDDDGSVHEPDIQAIAAAGITLGCAPDRYCPAQPVRRDEMASFLSRALGLGTLQAGPFTDIGLSPHAGAINAIAAAGITLGCASDRYCPAQPVRRDEMASFLTRAFSLTAAASPFADTAGNVHEQAIGALATAGITLGCAPSAYCPSASVRRDEMASFLARALGLEAVLVQMKLADSPTLNCTKDGLVCRGMFTIPHRVAYSVSEGFYHVLPFAAGEHRAFRSSTTRFELLVDGSAQPLVETTQDGSASSYRLFEGEVTLPPGRHQLVARWYWQGSLIRTTILDLDVRT